MAAKRASETAKSKRVFGQPRERVENVFGLGCIARVSTHDQQTLPLQMRAMREYAVRRGWTIALQIKEVGSGAAEREMRQKLLDAAAPAGKLDVVLVWRLDRWGRSLVDLVVTLKELRLAGRSVSCRATEALDLTTPTGRAMAGLLSVFAEFEHGNPPRADSRRYCRSPASTGKHMGSPSDGREKGKPNPKNFTSLASAKPRSPAN